MVTAVTSAFAYFTFSDSTTIDNVGTSSDNAKFNEVESDFYKVYFFASPYYATGATIDGVEETDPLKIADSGVKNDAAKTYSDTKEVVSKSLVDTKDAVKDLGNQASGLLKGLVKDIKK
mgnify:CR=1 FL=1